ncbi:MAG: hypothetical protein RR595_09545 [Lysinibacillus sp.]
MRLKINKGLENKFYFGVVGFLAISFFVFFTSKLWMYDDNPIKQTPFNTAIVGLEQTALVLKKWEYNPEKEVMEVMLETRHTGSDTVKATFAFAARESNALDKYPVKVVYQNENLVVLHIQNVPTKYRLVGLFVKEIRDKKIVESEARDQLLATNGTTNQDGEPGELVLPKSKEKIIIGDYRKIKMNSELGTKSKTAYEVEQTELEIKQLVKKIHVLEKEQFPLQDGIIVNIEEEIQKLEQDMVYKTEVEKQEVRRQILNKKMGIEKAKEKQVVYMEQANELREKRKMLLSKIDSLRKVDSKGEVDQD